MLMIFVQYFSTASQATLLLLLIWLIVLTHTQTWPVRGINSPVGWPKPEYDQYGRRLLNSRIQQLNLPTNEHSRHDPSSEYLHDAVPLQNDMYDDDRFNDHLENLVIPLAIIQGLKHAIVTGKKPSPLTLNSGQTQASNHQQEASTEVYTKENITEEKNREQLPNTNSPCNDGSSPPCCLNAVDYIACMLSNLQNSTNNTSPKENLPKMTLSDLDSTMLDEKILDNQVKSLVAKNPKIQQFKYENGEPVIVMIAGNECQQEYVLLSDINSGLMFAVPNKLKKCENDRMLVPRERFRPKGLQRFRGVARKLPSRSLRVQGDVTYESNPEAEELDYRLGITVKGRGNGNTNLEENDSSKDALPRDAGKIGNNVARNLPKFSQEARSKEERSSQTDSPESPYPTGMRRKIVRKMSPVQSLPTKRIPIPQPPLIVPVVEEPLPSTNISDSAVLPELKVDLFNETEEAASEDDKKFNNWFQMKGQPNNFCLAFPLVKSDCIDWVDEPNGMALKGRREAIFNNEILARKCAEQCTAANGLDLSARWGNSRFALVLGYVNGSSGGNSEHSPGQLNQDDDCGQLEQNSYPDNAGILFQKTNQVLQNQAYRPTTDDFQPSPYRRYYCLFDHQTKPYSPGCLQERRNMEFCQSNHLQEPYSKQYLSCTDTRGMISSQLAAPPGQRYPALNDLTVNHRQLTQHKLCDRDVYQNQDGYSQCQPNLVPRQNQVDTKRIFSYYMPSRKMTVPKIRGNLDRIPLPYFTQQQQPYGDLNENYPTPYVCTEGMNGFLMNYVPSRLEKKSKKYRN